MATAFHCSKCGRAANPGDRFCGDCRGAVVAHEPQPEQSQQSHLSSTDLPVGAETHGGAGKSQPAAGGDDDAWSGAQQLGSRHPASPAQKQYLDSDPAGLGDAGSHQTDDQGVRPERFPTMRDWLLNGMMRDWRGACVALFMTWFYLPVVILSAVFGVVFGAAAGAFGGAGFLTDTPFVGDYLDWSALQLGGLLGLIAGGLVGLVMGAVSGFVLPLRLVAGTDPLALLMFGFGQILVALVVGVLYLVYAVRAERTRLRLTGARQASRRERDFLEPLLQDVARQLRVGGRLPKLLMDDDRSPNAYAAMGHIVVTVGLLEHFDYDPEPVAAVLSHELVHWYNGDAVSASFIRGVALPLYLAYTALAWLLRVLPQSSVRLLVWVLFWPVLVSVDYVIIPVLRRDARTAEYRCDQGAILAGRRDGMRQALAHFHDTFDGAVNGWDEAVCATHPPNELRLERLELGGVVYPLPDENAPPRPIPVLVTSADE